MTSMIEREVTVMTPDDDIVLSANNVSKKFCRDLKRSLLYGVKDIASEVLGVREKSDTLRKKEFWALNNVSFQLRRGEALGLVGKNGSGKSTLLRIIAGLIRPDAGTVEVKGRVAPLIALGAGFNPVLTGRENIYANMAILGLTKQEIDDRFDEVIDFADIGDAIDSPVHSYSSGMAARLGFASAIHTNPDILLIDEVLAVGDVKFRVKCYRKLTKLRQSGVSFILVSHNPHSILGMCNTAVYLNRGELIATGEPDSIMSRYETDLFANETKETSDITALSTKSEKDNYGLNITSIYFRNLTGEKVEHLLSGEPGSICIRYRAHKRIDNLIANIMVQEKFGEGDLTLSMSNQLDRIPLNTDPGEYEVRFEMPYCCLKPGLYSIKLSICQEHVYNILDAVEAFNFKVESHQNMSQCAFYQPHSWKVI